MDSILNLFTMAVGYFGTAILLLPVIYGLFALRKKAIISFDMRLFFAYCSITFILQLVAVLIVFLFNTHNIILFRIYLPIHTAIFTYFLLKWIGLAKQYTYLIVFISILVSIIGDLVFSEPNYAPNFMTWFDAIFLLVLSFLLSYFDDKRKNKQSCENHYIHIGIYLYSFITVIGITPQGFDMFRITYFLQGLAVIFSSIYFARSFRCLYH